MTTADLWLHEATWDDTLASPAGPPGWRSLDGTVLRQYRAAATPGWTPLRPLKALKGASWGALATHHYVVETDIDEANVAEFNAWYDREHLPGLAAVPGTVRAARYQRAGSPRFLACYDLVSPDTLERPEWLAVRGTEWSAWVRPMFRNTRRTMFSAVRVRWPDA
ncbi:MAG: hypothetical protein ABW067_04435 [Rhizobacter sp.]